MTVILPQGDVDHTPEILCCNEPYLKVKFESNMCHLRFLITDATQGAMHFSIILRHDTKVECRFFFSQRASHLSLRNVS
jgi:hypothetical protein